MLVAPGFQVGARPPGATGLVIFETKRTLYAAPCKIGEVFATSGRTFDQVDLSQPFAPFSDGRSSGAAMLIGLIGDNTPSQTITVGIGIEQAAGAPPPVGAGGVAPLPVPGGPALTWELFDGGSPVALEVIRDETGGLIRSGLVELALPQRWRPGGPAGLPKVKSQRWLAAAGLWTLHRQPNALLRQDQRRPRARRPDRARRSPRTGAQQQRATDAGVADAGRRRLAAARDRRQRTRARCARRGSPGGRQASAQAATSWSEVADLAAYGPDDAVYLIDNTSGEITFGDRHHGRAPPEGFRNVRAASYRVMSPAPAQIDAGAITTALTSIQYLGKVSNPLPTEGGGPGNRRPGRQARPAGNPHPWPGRDGRGLHFACAARRGCAGRARLCGFGAAPAISGPADSRRGRRLRGAAGSRPGQADPDPEMLRAVADYLAQHAAPAGVEVVAAAPRYHDVLLDIGVVLEPGVDAGATLRCVLQAIDFYLHPITGGEAGDGWPFGGAIRYVPLLRLISRVDGVSAVKKLNVVLDGLRAPACKDVALTPYSLLWPAGHQVILLDDGSTP